MAGLLTSGFGTVVVIYAILFMNWDTKDTPFDGVSTHSSLYDLTDSLDHGLINRCVDS